MQLKKGYIFWVGMLALLLACQPTSKPDKSKRFYKVPSSESGITFTNQLNDTEVFNILNYAYYYNGGGVAVGDVNGDKLADIYFSANLHSNKLYLNQGDFSFKDITDSVGVGGEQSWSTGVSMVDINADGLLDIYVNNLGDFLDKQGHNELFINLGNDESGIPQFEESAAEYGLDLVGFSTQSVFFDFDLDGDLDMYQLNHSVRPGETVGDTSQRQVRDPLAGDKLMLNEDGKFYDISKEAGIFGSRIGYGLGVISSDINLDGWPDLYISNDFHEDDYLYLNNGDGTFTESLREVIGHTSKFSMGSDLGDMNNDGYPDLITLDMKPEKEEIIKTSEPPESYDIFEFKRSFGYYYQYARNGLHLNQGDGNFSEISQLAGVDATDWSWAALFCDLDNDGFQDLYITNGIYNRPNDMDFLKFLQTPKIARQLADEPGPEDLTFINEMPSVPQENYAYKNQGNLTFQNLAAEWGLDEKGFSNGAAYADFDNDGDLDLVVNNLNAPASVYRNQTSQETSTNYLKISLKGEGKNPFGYGAKVILYNPDGQISREQQPVRGFQSSVEPVLHVGLGAISNIDSVKVIWSNGQVEVKEDVQLGQWVDFEQVNASDLRRDLIRFHQRNPMFQEELHKHGITYTHQENIQFSEFRRESLIPHLLSTQGPDVSIGDVNGDLIDDIYLGGAAGQPGEIWIQNDSGKFSFLPNPEIENDREYEDVGSLFFDADNDGDQDLYIISGGNQYPSESPGNQDRLFLNDGKGNFTKWAVLPTQNSGSVVRPYDLDNDGDMDLFVGRHSIPGEYGVNPSSHIFLNQGSGKFEDITETIAPELMSLGMITDGIWIDFDGDEDKDLVVVGEWMPITILQNMEGQLVSADALGLEQSEGWWNRIIAEDFDHDGDYDFVVGNLGENSSMKASAEEPCTIYIKDFDRNGALDPIICYYNEGVSYPMASRDEFLGQLIGLRKKFPQYADYAGQTINDLFSPKELAGAIVKKVMNFSSVYIENVGNGQFKMKPLPQPAQFAPIYGMLPIDLDRDGNMDVLTGGNFYGVGPGRGRYDAGMGIWLKGNGNGDFKAILPAESGFHLQDEIRDIQLLQHPDGSSSILASRNNQSLQIFSLLKAEK